METPGERKKSSAGQLISVNRKDTSRLLEVFVKRSLSLNDSRQPDQSLAERKTKWVMKAPRVRRHSSDPSLHLSPDADGHDRSVAPPPPAPAADISHAFPSEEEVEPGEEEKVAAVSEPKKPSMWKRFVGFFSKKWAEDEPEDGPRRGETEAFQSRQEEVAEVAVNCLPLAAGSSPRSRFSRQRGSRRRLSIRKSLRKSSRKDITDVEAIGSVEPTYSYFEKVSEEMELIVHQVKDNENEKVMTNEEVINRIIALTKKEGDAIDVKLKENPTLSSFFQSMSYPAFRRLADTYLEDTTPTQDQAPSLPPAAATELVKLAVTLDFTAKVAGLSRQSVGHITGLGNRYLEDRFEYTQACTDHPWSDIDD